MMAPSGSYISEWVSQLMRCYNALSTVLASESNKICLETWFQGGLRIDWEVFKLL